MNIHVHPFPYHFLLLLMLQSYPPQVLSRLVRVISEDTHFSIMFHCSIGSSVNYKLQVHLAHHAYMYPLVYNFQVM